MKAARLIFLGDSICVGQGISIHKSWVSRIAARVEQLLIHYPNREIVVVNASVNGNTTRQALERMPYDVQSNGVDFIVIQFGMNDCNYWASDRGLPRVSAEAFAANLKEIIERSRRFGAREIILSTNHPTSRDLVRLEGAETNYEESNQKYNAIIRSVAESVKTLPVTLNDVSRRFEQYVAGNRERLEEMLLTDGLHLSAKGHDLYYALISPLIERMLDTFLSEDLSFTRQQ